RRRHTRSYGDWSSDVCSSDLYPIFTTATEDVGERFPQFFESRLTESDEEFAKRFASGRYRQQRGFVAQIGEQILHPETTPFELRSEERRVGKEGRDRRARYW